MTVNDLHNHLWKEPFTQDKPIEQERVRAVWAASCLCLTFVKPGTDGMSERIASTGHFSD